MYCKHTSIFSKLIPCLCALPAKHQHDQMLLIMIKATSKSLMAASHQADSQQASGACKTSQLFPTEFF